MRTSQMIKTTLAFLMLTASLELGYAQDSLGMRRVAVLDYWSTADDIQMVDEFAYVISANELHILDLTDPAHPVEIGQGSWWYGMSGSRICISNDRAYIATGCGVVVFDISDLTHPQRLAVWEPWEDCEVTDFFVQGTIAIIEANGYFFAVDISNLQNITIVGDFPLFYSPTALAGMTGDYLCMNGLGVSFWDIRNPASPVKVAEIDTLFYGRQAAIAGDRVYFGTEANGLRIIDVSNPLQPVEMGSCTSGNCDHVTVNGNLAIVTDFRGLSIWNIQNPAQPVFESTFIPRTTITAVASAGHLVCVGDREFHSPPLLVVDITNPMAPIAASTFGTKGFLWRIAVNGTIGCLASNWADCRTVDLSDPTQIRELGESHEIYPAGGLDVAARGNYAYLACGTQGLRVYDISDPTHPESLFVDDGATDYIERILIVGDYAYVIDGYSGSPFWLRTFDLTNSAIPMCVDTLMAANYTDGVFGFEAADEYLYIAYGWTMDAYSLVDPAHPQLIGSYHWPHVMEFGVWDLAILDHYAYVGYGYGGLRILDINNPVHITEVGLLWDYAKAVEVSGNTLITTGMDGLSVYSVADRVNPVRVGYYDSEESFLDMKILGPYLLTSGGCKFRVYQCDALENSPTPPEIRPQRFALDPCYPNPFNASTRIQFHLPQAAHAELTIFNALGQKITTLIDGMRLAGTYTLTWDGRTATGNDVASGLYIYQLKAGKFIDAKKMVLIR